MAGKKAQLFRDQLASARGLRRRPTEVEKRMWRLLRDRRFLEAKFRRQHPVGPYVVDFFCAKAKLVIELDGGGHGMPEKREADMNRSADLRSLGLRILRFWNTDVLENPEGVLKTIADAISTPSP